MSGALFFTVDAVDANVSVSPSRLACRSVSSHFDFGEDGLRVVFIETSVLESTLGELREDEEEREHDDVSCEFNVLRRLVRV